MAHPASLLPDVIRQDKPAILDDWRRELEQTASALRGRVTKEELGARGAEMLDHLAQAVSTGADGTAQADFAVLDRFFDEFARDRVLQGFNAEETATFVLSLKRPVFARLRDRAEPAALADALWDATQLVDKLALRCVGAFQRMREAVIERQQAELLELSTPVVKLWDGVLALPIIGTLDSQRTQVVMENLLEAIVAQSAEIAIIDITGVPTVDTLTAQHLLKTVAAARLMGADCIISGIRPQIAQTIVHLGVDLGNVTTKANLADALALALTRTGLSVAKTVRA